MRNTVVRTPSAAASAAAVAKGATLAPLLRRPYFPPFDFGPRRPPQSRRLRAPSDVPPESRIVLRRGVITLR